MVQVQIKKSTGPRRSLARGGREICSSSSLASEGFKVLFQTLVGGSALVTRVCYLYEESVLNFFCITPLVVSLRNVMVDGSVTKMKLLRLILVHHVSGECYIQITEKIKQSSQSFTSYRTAVLMNHNAHVFC